MYCQYESCRTCCQTYILGESTAKCMNSKCGREWTRKFICDSFPTSFINGPLKKHREDVIFDRERALLPATQPYAEAIGRKNTLMKEYNEINQMIRDLKRRKERIQVLVNRLEHNPVRALEEGDFDRESDSSHEKTRRQFIKPCPVDDCRGFLSSQYKCGMCETWCCPDCHVIIGKTKTTPHTCDPNDVESVKLMKVETKPCPKCAVPIFKIDGCNQIWCTQCHIAFDFTTGQIETKIHNPHYYEYLRQHKGGVPRDPLDVPGGPCGPNRREPIFGRQTSQDFTILFDRQLRNSPEKTREEIMKFTARIYQLIRNVIHIQEVEMRDEEYEQKNRDLRIRYLTKEINEDKFKILLQQAEKKHSKHTEVQDVYRLVSTAATDIILRYLHFLRNDPHSRDKTIIDEIDGLIEYANQCMYGIKYTYGCQIKVFTETLAPITK